LSQQLNVSISTALEAWRLLEDQGKIQARTRSGYYVSTIHRPNIVEPAISDPLSTASPPTISGLSGSTAPMPLRGASGKTTFYERGSFA
jgi:DNA-binding transcriptional regulator YhcF (GntR family)